MTNKREDTNTLGDFVSKYVESVRAGFEQRWMAIKPSIYDTKPHECIGGLLSRQATLTLEMAVAPSTWNGHSAPLFLRCMVDAHIALTWILGDPDARSERYVKYGLGQKKLAIEYLEEALTEDRNERDAQDIRRMIDMGRAWLNSQWAEWATEVNVGSWSGMSTREMAKEIGRESIYKHAYVPFSGCVHNMWQHVAIYNMKRCENALHKGHFVPDLLPERPDVDYMYRSARYVSLSYKEFDKKMDVTCDVELPEDVVLAHPLFSGGG